MSKNESLKNFIKARNKMIKGDTIMEVNKLSEIIKDEFNFERTERTEKAIEKIYAVF